jgi:hypothetical protein
MPAAKGSTYSGFIDGTRPATPWHRVVAESSTHCGPLVPMKGNPMKSRHLLAAAALALTGAAASASPSVFTDMPSTMSRAEVLAQVDQHRAEGRSLRANDAYGAAPGAADIGSSGLSRDEVLNELVAARASGEFDSRGEVYGNFVWTQFGNVEQPLPEQASVVAAREEAAAAAAIAAATLDEPSALATNGLSESADPSMAGEPVVLWVPLDGEAITLRPGEAVLLVPSDEVSAPDAE